ncbi:MAG TPA: hypothetical protein VHX52_13175 [Steroidobacteraceae bacterium]|jgi:hypothetical protein|nr:hypothetical protein [Steroidobacteraceae bacterium]
MQKIKDVLRLHLLGGMSSRRQLARAVGCGKSAVPDWTKVREELARPDNQVTLALLWQEYKSEQPDGYAICCRQ